MASLSNLHTGNDPGVRLFPSIQNRVNEPVGLNLNDTNRWDIANVIPVNPQSTDLRNESHARPNVNEKIGERMQQYFVRTHPYEQRLLGGNADSILLYQPRAWLSWFRGRRYVPY